MHVHREIKAVLCTLLRVAPSGQRIGLALGCASALMSIFGAPTTSRAEDPASAARPTWVLYGGPEVAIYGGTGKANSSSSEITGPRVANPRPRIGDLGTLISDPERSREEVLAALVGGTFGVMTPELMSGPVRPRFFLDVNISAAMASEVQLARRSNPGPISINEPRSPSFPTGEGTLLGIGTQITAQPQGPQIHAAFGPAFEFSVDENIVRIRPAVVYSRTVLDIKGQTKRAVRLNEDAGVNQTLDDFRLIELDDSMREVYHGAGPALEIEYEPGMKLGPFNLTLYLRAHASYLFGDLETSLQQANPDPAAPGETVSWRYEQDRWAYRAGTGLRLNWAPSTAW